jgi:pimeloyl-ACP methyl ester carboxylesterase
MIEQGPVPRPGAGPIFFRRRGFRIAVGVLAVSAIGAVWMVTALQRYLTFPRAHPSVEQPAAMAVAGGEAHWFEVDGGRVEAWFLPASGDAPAPLMIHAHGNGELIDIQTKSVAALRAAGIGILLVEYPGYGRSPGNPSEKTVTAAFVAAYDWAMRDARVDATRIIGYGRSLGGGAVAQLAARRPLAALVLESTFISLAEVIRETGVPDWLVVNRFDTRAVLANYPGPVLVLHGTRDGTFPVEHARWLQAASPRATLRLEICGHNDCPTQWELLLGFLAHNGVFNNQASGDSP